MRGKIISLLVILLVLIIPGTLALSGGTCATAEVTSINPSSVDSDEDFTVGIEITNCGEDPPLNVTFEITSISPDISVKESLVQNIGKMEYANSKRFITFHMHSSPNAIPGQHLFKTRLTYGDGPSFVQKDLSFSVTLTSEEPDITVSKISTEPEFPKTGDNVILTIDVENAGKGEAKDVRVSLNNNLLSGAKLVYLGKINPDENLPARFLLTAEKSGIQNSEIEIQYKANGETKNLKFPFSLSVAQKNPLDISLAVAIIIILVLLYLLYKGKVNISK